MNAIQNVTLARLGLSPNMVCYWYASAALEIVRRDPQALICLTKSVYCTVADAYGVSPAAVESSLRRMVADCWHDNPSAVIALVGMPCARRPTVGQLLSAMARYT